MVGFMFTPLARSGRDFGRFRAPAGCTNLRGAVDDRSDASSGTFGRDVEGRSGMLRLKLLRQLRNEFRAERVGALDDKSVCISLRRNGSKPECQCNVILVSYSSSIC